MTVKATTRDIGLAIRDFLEGSDFFAYEDGDATGELWAKTQRNVDVIDVSDPNNLHVVLDNGQVFRVSIFAEG